MEGEIGADPNKIKAALQSCNLKSKGADDFTEFEETLKKIQDILDDKGKDEPDTDKKKDGKPRENIDFDKLDVDNVRLTVRENRTVINKKSIAEDKEKDDKLTKTMDQQSFMEQVEKDANDRAETRANHEYEAELLRAQGNEAFRTEKFEKAVILYGKAIGKIKDSAITYNNRALCYIKLRNYKRALLDCQYVLEKLQKSNLRAWLYQATAYKRLNQTDKFEESVAKAREHNPNQMAYIDKYIKQLEAEE